MKWIKLISYVYLCGSESIFGLSRTLVATVGIDVKELSQLSNN